MSVEVYGLGHSEAVVGQALRAIPASSRPSVFTKCRLIADPARPFEDPLRTLAPESIRREVEASLRRLGVERIDLYQCHWPDGIGTPVEDSWAEMARLVEAGKVGAVGVSNFDVPLLERAQAIHPVASLQPPFSPIRRDAGADVIPWAAAHGTTVSAVAVAWTLAWPRVTGAIVGARTAAQVDGWIAAGSLVLSLEDLDEIASAVTRTGAGSGPIDPATPTH